MGGGTYSSTSRAFRATTLGYYDKSAQEIFTQRNINNAMSPYGIKVRESRDSLEHPESLAIILGLDVTGSMGSVPHYLVKDGLPLIIEKLIAGGISDPQVLFLGIGDHEVDKAPLQVGQFESSDELLDKWLTTIFLEGGGGGNGGESYLLAWYFAALHTSIDCWEKRQHKGYCITIGDEPILPEVPASFLKGLMGLEQPQKYTAMELIDLASKTYNIYHINIIDTVSGQRKEVYRMWKELLSDNLKQARREEVADVIADIILSQEQPTQIQTTSSVDKPAEEMML